MTIDKSINKVLYSVQYLQNRSSAASHVQWKACGGISPPMREGEADGGRGGGDEGFRTEQAFYISFPEFGYEIFMRVKYVIVRRKLFYLYNVTEHLIVLLVNK